MVTGMASITLKSIPMELHAQLKNEAAANFRQHHPGSHEPAGTDIARLMPPWTTKRDQQWIDEAIASGPATPLTKRKWTPSATGC